ncbi:hypothetical protein EYF80_068096 [Liparis tanakae]|uniref:Uncharacterized protein n=1 Tax=Liparis tanakae TaxID=230148 RepID=A0A4Z2E079_9TELE|nr:hypothetical protein EYF80_068096 [Liparis tanakae]
MLRSQRRQRGDTGYAQQRPPSVPPASTQCPPSVHPASTQRPPSVHAAYFPASSSSAVFAAGRADAARRRAS